MTTELLQFVLDTCVVSELWKPRPAPQVVEWFEQTDEATLGLSVMTVGELQKGVDRLPRGRRRTRLTKFVGTFVERFEGRILPVSVEVARAWGNICAAALNHGSPMQGIDALIAATARVHRLTVVTRNVQDFAPSGVMTVNPFEAP